MLLHDARSRGGDRIHSPVCHRVAADTAERMAIDLQIALVLLVITQFVITLK